MPFPTVTPSSRSYDPGNWPVKTFASMSGASVRIRYGNHRTGAVLNLSYDNLPDATAQQFLDHYAEVEGTFKSFALPVETMRGWSGGALSPGTHADSAYRYSSSPKVTNVRPGRSSVSVELQGVM
jgi:hypothetical protein